MVHWNRDVAYTLSEAAKATGKSRVTMRRYLDAQRFPHAFQEPSGGSFPAWRIPVADLLAAGFRLDDRAQETSPDRRPEPDTGADESATDDTITDLRGRLAVATALAEERSLTISLLAKQVDALQAMLAEALATVRAMSQVPGSEG